MAQGAFTWNGGESITQQLWQTESSWTLDGDTTWKDGGTGPLSPGSDMWDQTNISNASGSIDNLEGWEFKLNLVNSNLTVASLKKLQGGSQLDIDSNSTLTVTSFGGGNDGGAQIVNNYGVFNLGLNKNTGGDGFTFNLGETGIVNITGGYTLDLNTLAATLTLGDSAYGERTLISLANGAVLDSVYNLNLTIDGYEQVDSEDELAANKFFVDTTNGITVKYGVVPEPTTATLSLLALAGLAVRRRRK